MGRRRRGGRGLVPEGRTVAGRRSSSRQAMTPRGQRVWRGGRGLMPEGRTVAGRRTCSSLRRAMPPRSQRFFFFFSDHCYLFTRGRKIHV